MATIGWNFPLTNGGEEQGWRHSGIGHFRGSPVRSLARETIQNSLDARANRDEAVHVAFELRTIATGELDHVSEWRAALRACQRNADESKTAQDEISTAIETLEQDEITFLRVADWNTTGLNGEKWRALVKAQSVTVKDNDAGAGGSHGLGKFAPYAVSRLRTVLYWTKFDEPMRESVVRFQGRAVFMTHQSQRPGMKGQTQGTGYYGKVEECRELDAQGVPPPIRAAEESTDRGSGTSLWIAGWQPHVDWGREIAATVIESFYPAISRGDLEVFVDYDGFIGNVADYAINSDNLNAWFDYLLQDEQQEQSAEEDQEMSGLALAHRCWQMMNESEPAAEITDPHFGRCTVWAQFEPNLPSRIAVVRGTGMVITTEQGGLRLRAPKIDDFAAVAQFEDPEGNELIRRMENPKHDQIEPSWLPEDERDKREQQLKALFKKIRKSVRGASPERPMSDPVPISELAKLLPDTKREGDTNLGDLEEGQLVRITPPPPRPPRPPRPPSPDYIALDRQRAQPTDDGRIRLSFTPVESGAARLEVREVGDSETSIRSDLQYHGAYGVRDLVAGERLVLEFSSTTGDVRQRAWTVTARKQES